MDNKKILIPAFILVALVQLYFPAKMIFDQEDIIEAGKEYKFKTAPVDPTDPFRGKYITLNYEANSFPIDSVFEYTSGEEIYVFLMEDEEGFVKIDTISKEKPLYAANNYVKANIRYFTRTKPNKLLISYPFNRYYMEEFKAKPAEDTYRKTQRDSSKITYALVSVKNGEAVLKDVLINGVPIKDVVESNLKKE